MTRRANAAAAAACLLGAAALLLLALEVSRAPAALQREDLRYALEPEARGLWDAGTPAAGAARALLGLEDDVAFRRALRALRVAGVREPEVSDPRLALLRSEARARLAAIAAVDGDARRRSRAVALLGVISHASGLASIESASPLLNDAVARYRAAIALDADNDEAKVNLELSLRRDQEVAAGGGGERPTPGGEGAAGAGTREAGSGY